MCGTETELNVRATGSVCLCVCAMIEVDSPNYWVCDGLII